jgi:hypothetical protein
MDLMVFHYEKQSRPDSLTHGVVILSRPDGKSKNTISNRGKTA